MLSLSSGVATIDNGVKSVLALARHGAGKPLEKQTLWLVEEDTITINVVDVGDYTGFDEFIAHWPWTGPVVQDVLGRIGIALFLPLGEWYRVI